MIKITAHNILKTISPHKKYLLKENLEEHLSMTQLFGTHSLFFLFRHVEAKREGARGIIVEYVLFDI